MMKTTPWKEYSENGHQYRICTTYGLDYDFARRANQDPYFSATCSIEEKRGGRWKEYAGGADSVAIAQHFPELAQYLKWHLVSTGQPMHYIANAKYWWEMAMGKIKPSEYQRVDPKDAFKTTIILGGIPGEQMPYSNDWQDVEKWLRDRLPKLMGFFAADMKNLAVLE